MESKTCKTCHQTLPLLENFSKACANRDGYQDKCKKCTSIYLKGYYKRKSGEIKERVRIYRKKNINKIKEYDRLRRANKKLSKEQWQELSKKYKWVSRLKRVGWNQKHYDEQITLCGSKCANTACNNDWYHLDHDHKTGKPRGPLCHKCNVSIGMVADDLEKLKGLVKYLESWV